MYKKYMTALLFLNLIALVAVINITELRISRIMATPAFKLSMAENMMPAEEMSDVHEMVKMASGQRVIAYEIAETEREYRLSEDDYEVLLRIVEAEAGGEDEEGKMLVACVVLNRVADPAFPDTVREVVFQKEKGTAQFSPAYNGRYEEVTVSEDTIQAVERVLQGEDISKGALYFAARKYADSSKMKWFDEKLTFLFRHGGHEFFH
ncbi:MAG: cell wall hydrolase [Lachnospiraceae bacterium]